MIKTYLLLSLFSIMTLSQHVAQADSRSCINLFRTTSLFDKKVFPKKTQHGFLVTENEKEMFYRVDVPTEQQLAAQTESKVILLVHGLAANSDYLAGVAERLVQQGHYVVRVDLFGHGRSLYKTRGKNKDSNATIEEQAAAIAQILLHFGISELSIYGHSFGGAVSIQTVVELQNNYPKVHVKRLIIDETYFWPLGEWTKENVFLASMFASMIDSYSTPEALYKAMVSAIKTYPKYFEFSALSPEELAKGIMQAFPVGDMTKAAQQVLTPSVILVRGSIPSQLAPTKLLDQISGFFNVPVEKAVVPTKNDSHHHPYESPDEVAKIIVRP